MLKHEEWKVIEDFPRYQVSSLGRVKSMIGTEKLLKPYNTHKGYLTVRLSKKNIEHGKYITKDIKVHRLVAKYFCENYSEDKEIHHKNKDRSDNRATNLICLTKKEHSEIHRIDRAAAAGSEKKRSSAAVLIKEEE